MARKGKAPAGCYWENGVLYYRIKINGKRHRGSVYTSDPVRAKQLREAKKRELTEQLRFGADDPNYFADVLAKWLVQLPTAVGPSTETRYICSMDQLKPFLRDVTLAQIGRKLLWEIVEERQKKVENATIKRDLSALSALMEYAVARGWMGDRPNPVPAVMRAIPEKRDPINLPHDDDIARVMRRAHRPYDNLMKAALLTGCRIEELVGAARRDFDPKAKTLTIRKAKHNSVRVIDLTWNSGDKFFASLPEFPGKQWLFWRDEDKRVRSDSKRKPTFKGDKLDDASQNFRRITDAVANECEGNGTQFVRFVFHDLRHRHAVDYLASGKPGCDVYALNKRMGHSSLKQTEEYLEHITPEQARIAKYGRAA
jgi:integrase/recombinase XerD